jgi:hypothetical protein
MWRDSTKRFLERPQVEFLRPCAAVLHMQLPVTFGDGFELQQAVVAGLFHALRRVVAQALAVDAAIDHHMRHMNALRAEFARQALAQRTQRSLGRSEGRERRLAAQRRGGAGEQQGAACVRPGCLEGIGQQAAQRLMPEDEAAQRAGAPGLRELVDRQLQRWRAHPARGIEDGHGERAQRPRLLRNTVHLGLARHVARKGMSPTAGRNDFAGHRIELGLRAAGQRNDEAFGRETPRKCRTQARAGADTGDPCNGRWP